MSVLSRLRPMSPLQLPARTPIGRLDRRLSRFIQGHRHEPLTKVCHTASAWWFRSLVIGGVGALADYQARHRPRTALYSGFASVAAALASEGAKPLIRRTRPPYGAAEIVPLVAIPVTYSFPSGHATTAFAAAAAADTFYPRLRVVLYGLAGLVGFSRVYLGVHYPSDVAAGAVFGTGIGKATAWVFRRERIRKAVDPVGPADPAV
jgi:undecaprenyl-diphosphatase